MSKNYKSGIPPSYNEPPPSYEESQKHEKIEDISGSITYPQAIGQSPVQVPSSHQAMSQQQFPVQVPPSHQAMSQQQYSVQVPPSYQSMSQQQRCVQPVFYPGQQAVIPAHQPPSFSSQPNPTNYPRQQYFVQVSPSHQTMYQQQSMANPILYPGQEVMVPAAFDPGVRFNPSGPPSIPPPPPGVAPNFAQMVTQYGARVVTSKQKSSFW